MSNHKHEYDDAGKHRLVIGNTIGDWVPYAFIAFLQYNGKKYAATTLYYEGSLPRVFEVVEVTNFNEIIPD